MGLEVGLGAAFLAGLLSFLSPCVLPLVPPYLCFLTGASLDDLASPTPARMVGRAVPRALLFCFGFGTIFVLLGASATTVGRVAGDHLSWLTWVAGGVICILGLHFLGLRIPLLYREARLHVERRPAGLAGSYLVGLAFGFGWTPCVGPVLASILMLAGAEDSAGAGARLLAAYAAGIGVPFVAAAAFVPSFMALLRRLRGWMGLVEKTMGAALVGTGLLVISGMMPMIGAWLLENVPGLGRFG